jgi:hypothetical protein
MNKFSILILLIFVLILITAAAPMEMRYVESDTLLDTTIGSVESKDPPPCFPNCKIRKGEPRMEKVSYFKYANFGKPNWSNSHNYDGYWSNGCYTFYYQVQTYKLPIGCNFRYQY